MSTTSMAIFSNPLFATYSVYARNASTAENVDTVNDLALNNEGASRDTKNYPSDRQRNWHFAEVSGMHHKQRHSAKVSEETILAWSGIQHSAYH